MEWKLTSKSKWSQVPSQDAQGLRMWKCLTADELLIKLYGCAYCTFKKMTTKRQWVILCWRGKGTKGEVPSSCGKVNSPRISHVVVSDSCSSFLSRYNGNSDIKKSPPYIILNRNYP
ncbi:hypothetical protein QQP08_024669 [Theobroma cacao]|nr:hypothetical protein QQP08_024669 [Theobroma cacao]